MIKFENVSIITILFTIIIQFYTMDPIIYSNLKLIMYGLLIVLFLYIILLKSFKMTKLLKEYIISIYFQLFIFSFFSFLNNESVVDVKQVTPYISVLIAMIVSSNLKFSKKKIKTLFRYYTVFTGILGNLIVLRFVGSYTIQLQYSFISKNQVGPLLGIGLIILIYHTFSKRQLFIQNYSLDFFLKIFLIIINLIPLIIIRNRTTMVVVLLLGIIMMWREVTWLSMSQSIKAAMGILLLFLLFTFSPLRRLPLLFYESIFINRDISDINSISGNRWIVYVETIYFLKENILFGTLLKKSNISTPHNYVLYYLFNFGLIGALPTLIFYFRLVIFNIGEFIINKKHKIDLSIYLLAFALLNSLSEYSSPFGPGTTYFFVWFLLIKNQIEKDILVNCKSIDSNKSL